jgi:prepilin-type N-terminal cleavage/methylation domain-containing protein
MDSMTAVPPAPTFPQRGFTLTEMAVVLVIVSLLIGGMLLPMTAQDDMRRSNETRATLANIQEALLGFAVVKGRLPCPASPSATGDENPEGGNCVNFSDGFVPGISLGLQPVDREGYVIDAWGRRIRYAVTNVNIGATTFTFTTSGAMNTAGLASLAPNLSICSTASGVIDPGTATAKCAAGAALSSSAVVVLLSTGKNGAGMGADEQANSTAHDRVFISHEPTPGTNEFDDIVVWLSPNILINRMISAGRLP